MVWRSFAYEKFHMMSVMWCHPIVCIGYYLQTTWEGGQQQEKQAQTMCYALFGLRWVFLCLKFVFFWYLLYVLVAIYELCEREAGNNKNELKWCITCRLGVRWVFFPLNSCFFDTNQCLIVCIGYYLWTTWEGDRQQQKQAQTMHNTSFGPLVSFFLSFLCISLLLTII